MRLAATLVLLSASALTAADGNRLAYLDECDPYYPHRTFPKLVTPQWVGEPGVEAVVILAIDDMRGHEKWEAFLRPILERLKKIDGRAPVSIMTCSVDPHDPQLQAWLKEGLSIECHTVDHPCPFFKPGFAQAKSTYDRCVDLMHTIPGNKPVAFRMPCCDSLNTPSPRHWAEIFNKTTAKGNYLTLDSSVFNVFTSADPALPKDLVLDETGQERFKKYLPKDRSFVNTIENYPYPYVIGNLCWQFPCTTPSDWQAQHLHKPNNPQTVKDWTAALDCTVVKQGVFNMVFHPHGWIKAEQVVEFIDHAVQKHGKKVKFLTFKECQERLVKNLQGGYPIKEKYWYKNEIRDCGIRILDLDNDGYMDVAIGHTDFARRGDKNCVQETRLWDSKGGGWRKVEDLPDVFDWYGYQFGILRPGNFASLFYEYDPEYRYHFDGKRWTLDKSIRGPFSHSGGDVIALRDIDGDGRCEIIYYTHQNQIDSQVFSWCAKEKAWKRTPFELPPGACRPWFVDKDGMEYATATVEFIDIDGDGKLDVIFSDEREYGVYLFTDMEKGWSRKVIAGKAGDKNSLPPITRNGTNNGFFVHSGSLWWSNEDTVLLKDHVARLSFKELLDREPKGQPPAVSKERLPEGLQALLDRLPKEPAWNCAPGREQKKQGPKVGNMP
jgi:peptidoglycan/xylan/chitin deacetylase (PgdA/CDA1 family)